MKRIVFGLGVTVLVFSVAMQAQSKAPQAGPEYNVLDAWAGEWNN